jgi:hypothetical protein
MVAAAALQNYFVADVGFGKPRGHLTVYPLMPTSRENTPKVELGGKGVGVASPADLQRRAKEIALIDGRTRVTPEDRARARAELQDRDLPPTLNEDAETMQSLSRDPSDPPADRGHRAPEYGGDDEKAQLERLALEGVEEAQHEQMVQSRNNVDEPLRSRPRRTKK